MFSYITSYNGLNYFHVLFIILLQPLVPVLLTLLKVETIDRAAEVSFILHGECLGLHLCIGSKK
jgi:hypothetical protein